MQYVAGAPLSPALIGECHSGFWRMARAEPSRGAPAFAAPGLPGREPFGAARFCQSGAGCLQLRLRLRLVPVIEVRLRWGPFPQRSMVKDWARLRLILSPGSRKRPRAEPIGLAGAPSPALDGERSGEVLLDLSGGDTPKNNRRAGRRCEPSAVGKAPPSGTATVAERPSEGRSGKLRGARRLLRQESGRCHKPTTEPCVSARAHGKGVDGSSTAAPGLVTQPWANHANSPI